ncbi:hypothetical protein HYDPIDRAFT_118826 [Hydnomerulius pinastri MD-312]|uniref:Uncharacterized protein n=1 Tax=Hydnomerulius pinastri MD-312 TaxID=994086 RepID=A0A0C9VZY5_9AGAM|nr:hypothetical protein HYDPIDRAFT_118826 [Hydnomerulius pinastri MD-312]
MFAPCPSWLVVFFNSMENRTAVRISFCAQPMRSRTTSQSLLGQPELLAPVIISSTSFPTRSGLQI